MAALHSATIRNNVVSAHKYKNCWTQIDENEVYDLSAPPSKNQDVRAGESVVDLRQIIDLVE